MTEEDGARQASQFEERAALLLTLRQAGLRDLSVLRAMEATPREAFAPYRFRDLANRNLSLPIGCGQTMSRPVELARRLEALKIGRGHRVLEVGAGSGYGAAALA
ncbi:MAG: protein-L-isoaspartate(D-aspartate) O-methyltransferase, partial [Methylocystis sp.]